MLQIIGIIAGVIILGIMLTPSLRNRVVTLFKVKAHSALDSLEDSVETLKQKVRELKESYDKSITGLANVKTVEINYRKVSEDFKNKAVEYHNKAVKLKEKLKDDDAQLKSDILLMLQKEQSMIEQSETALKNAENQKVIVDNLEAKIKEMKILITSTSDKITNLEAQRDAAKINKTISKEMSNLNFDGISSQIEEIEKHISNDNSEAQSWNTIGNELQTDEERINKTLQNDKVNDSELLNNFLNK
jgi:phage shock protein A